MKAERGQALIETLLLGLVMLAPLLWALGMLAELHRSALATTSAAREAGFEVARSSDPISARRSAELAVAMAMKDHGLDPSQARVQLSIVGLHRSAPIQVVVSYPTRVVAAPFLGSVAGPSVWIHAKSVARIDPYRDRS